MKKLWNGIGKVVTSTISYAVGLPLFALLIAVGLVTALVILAVLLAGLAVAGAGIGVGFLAGVLNTGIGKIFGLKKANNVADKVKDAFNKSNVSGYFH